MLNWADETLLVIDRNRAKAGWGWFERRWLEEESNKELLDEGTRLAWPARIGRFEFGPFWIVPLESSVDLICEAIAMRNCVRDYEARCATGEYEVYSVRDRGGRRRRACVGVGYNAHGIMTSVEAKGPANAALKRELEPVVTDLIRRLSASSQLEW